MESIGLAGLNIALPTYSLINALGLALGIGAGVVLTVAKARGDHTQADHIPHCALAWGLLGLDGVWLIVPAAEPLTFLCATGVLAGLRRQNAALGTSPAGSAPCRSR